MRVHILVGTRPNFIKVTQFKKLASRYRDLMIEIVHTGQHYDEKMADVFFQQLRIKPDHSLNIKPNSPNRQIAEIMLKLEDLFDKIGRPDLLIVPGDVNSTLAGALCANKCNIPLAHLEAGLRSFDRGMPEEFNRLITDQLSDLFFVTEPGALTHLKAEGVAENKIHFVGNTMIDTMVAFESEIESSAVIQELSLRRNEFVLMTMHRPATVDNMEELEKLVALIGWISEKYKIVFPVHPRTIRNMKELGLYERVADNPQLVCTEPLDYFSFQKLVKYCKFIVTDSGGIQEESTFRQKPCLTLRPNTERPVTVEEGTNTLLPFALEQVKQVIWTIEKGTYKKGSIPQLWDGKATGRIMEIISRL
jgi:UDP-N-acetylglucosamine 2-epimerase (non-hydrolysing)